MMVSTFVDNQFQFAEMNLRYTGSMEKLITLVKRAVRMGYDSIIINYDIGDLEKDVDDSLNEEAEPPRKKKKKGKNVSREKAVPDPVEVDKSLLNTADLEAAGKKLRLFSRLTVTISDSTDMHVLMHHPQVRKYDLLAIRPIGEQTLQTLSRKGDFVDIVTYDQQSTSIPWLSRSKLIQSCVNEGISFEISYAGALKDVSQRRAILSNGRQLMLATRGGRGVLLDSGADEMIDLRGPFDAANLAILFGIRPEEARKFVSGNPKRALLRAESRKTIKGAVVVTDPDAVPSRSLNRRSALEKLVRVPEFRAQIEILKDENDEGKLETT